MRWDQTLFPFLLRWATGKQPFWHKAVNPVRVRLGQKPLKDDLHANKEKARAAFFFLRERGREAVPALLGRLTDPTLETGRFSIHIICEACWTVDSSKKRCGRCLRPKPANSN